MFTGSDSINRYDFSEFKSFPSLDRAPYVDSMFILLEGSKESLVKVCREEAGVESRVLDALLTVRSP